MSLNERNEQEGVSRFESDRHFIRTKIVIFQVFLFVLMYFFSPHYLLPFANDFYGRSSLVLFLLWQILGASLWKKFDALPPASRIGTAVLFFGPLTCAPLLGPAFQKLWTHV